MYRIRKRIEISASHMLETSSASACNNLHGHNWIITVYCEREELDDFGMVIDYKDITYKIEQVLDHRNLNDVLECNPTAENIAKWVVDKIPYCYRADVEECENSWAS